MTVQKNLTFYITCARKCKTSLEGDSMQKNVLCWGKAIEGEGIFVAHLGSRGKITIGFKFGGISVIAKFQRVKIRAFIALFLQNISNGRPFFYIKKINLKIN